MLTQEERKKFLAPSEQEQAWLILQGKCPHNGNLSWEGHGHNDDCYTCSLCGYVRWW